MTVTTDDKLTLRAALNAKPQERDLWESTLAEKLHLLDEQNAWYPVDSPGLLPFSTYAVLKFKRIGDGTVKRFKARIVPGGNFQMYGKNYMEYVCSSGIIHHGASVLISHCYIGNVYWTTGCQNRLPQRGLGRVGMSDVTTRYPRSETSMLPTDESHIRIEAGSSGVAHKAVRRSEWYEIQ